MQRERKGEKAKGLEKNIFLSSLMRKSNCFADHITTGARARPRAPKSSQAHVFPHSRF